LANGETPNVPAVAGAYKAANVAKRSANVAGALSVAAAGLNHLGRHRELDLARMGPFAFGYFSVA
jgi:hypothetical protein